MIFTTIFDPGTFLQKPENIAPTLDIFKKDIKTGRGTISKTTLTLSLTDNQIDDRANRAIGKAPLI